MTKRRTGIIVTIDGPSGAGKTTVAKELARKWVFMYMDTGAMFRTFALYLIQNGFTRDIECLEQNYNPAIAAGLAENYLEKVDIQHINGEQHMFLEKNDITGKIRTQDVSDMASRISTFPEVRDAVLKLERRLAASGLNLVTEGRDMGSVVFPDADLKIYLTADENIRAVRRYFQTPDQFKSREHALSELQARDHRDMNRKTAPLVQPEDAYFIDSTHLSLDSTIQLASRLLIDTMANKNRKQTTSTPKWYAAKFRTRIGIRLDITKQIVLFLYKARNGYYGDILAGPHRTVVNTIHVQDDDINAAKQNAEMQAWKYIKEQLDMLNPALQTLNLVMESHNNI